MNIFPNNRYIFDGGMGQYLIEKGMVTKGTLWSASALIDERSSTHSLESVELNCWPANTVPGRNQNPATNATEKINALIERRYL